MEPAEQVRAFAEMENKGLELVGIFHSHPAGPGTAEAARVGLSPTDIAEAAYPVTQSTLVACQRSVGSPRLLDRGPSMFRKLSLTIKDSG